MIHQYQMPTSESRLHYDNPISAMVLPDAVDLYRKRWQEPTTNYNALEPSYRSRCGQC